MIDVTFPDNSTKQFKKGVTGLEIAKTISKGICIPKIKTHDFSMVLSFFLNKQEDEISLVGYKTDFSK